jgi:hypothetical protein
MKDGKSKIISNSIIIPDNVQIGDFVVVRYKESIWARHFFYEDWHHVALVTKTDPLTIVEAIGENNKKQPFGPTELVFSESVGFGKSEKNIIKIKWLKPVFPKPIREIALKKIPQSKRIIITEKEARKRVIAYALEQTKNKEPYSEMASKWNENEWYCSLFIYKSYSRTITNMYLEDYSIKAGYWVTPEDLVDSKRSKVYFTWYNSKHFEGDIPPEDMIYFRDEGISRT